MNVARSRSCLWSWPTDRSRPWSRSQSTVSKAKIEFSQCVVGNLTLVWQPFSPLCSYHEIALWLSGAWEEKTLSLLSKCTKVRDKRRVKIGREIYIKQAVRDGWEKYSYLSILLGVDQPCRVGHFSHFGLKSEDFDAAKRSVPWCSSVWKEKNTRTQKWNIETNVVHYGFHCV